MITTEERDKNNGMVDLPTMIIPISIIQDPCRLFMAVRFNFATNNDIPIESVGGQEISGSPITKKPKLGLESAEEQLAINNNNNSRTNNNKNSNQLTPIKMQTEGIRVPGLNQDLSREITKFDSSEFDVSFCKLT